MQLYSLTSFYLSPVLKFITQIYLYIVTTYVNTSLEDILIIMTDTKVEPLLLSIDETCVHTAKQVDILISKTRCCKYYTPYIIIICSVRIQ